MSILKDAIKKTLRHEQEDPVKMEQHDIYLFIIKN